MLTSWALVVFMRTVLGSILQQHGLPETVGLLFFFAGEETGNRVIRSSQLLGTAQSVSLLSSSVLHVNAELIVPKLIMSG